MPTLASSPTAMTPDDGERIDAFSFPPAASGGSSPGSPSKTSPEQQSRARRQPAYYPNVNSTNKLQKPFSRSAAKRESVMALGSIEHLQHYFTKAGIAAKQDALKQNKGLVPAIGGASSTHAPQRPSLGSIQEFHLPPSPVVTVFRRPANPTVEKTYEVDPEALKPGVIADLEAVADAWCLPPADAQYAKRAEEPVDVLTTLQRTTALVRAVRNYMLSLLDASSIPTSHSDLKPRFRPSSLQPVPIKRVVSGGAGAAASDPLARIRRSALDVLTVLRTLEDSARVPLDDDAYDAQSDRLSSQDSRSPETQHPTLLEPEPEPIDLLAPSRGASPTPKGAPGRPSLGHDVSFAVSLVTLPGRAEGVPVWDEPEDDFNMSDGEGAGEKHDVWDERLVLGGGWLYRQDIKLSDLKAPREVVGRYLNACDEVLFGGPIAAQAEDASEGSGSTSRRSWLAERARLEKEKARAGSRRSSLGRERSPAGSREGKRVVSADVMNAMRAMVITEENSLVEEPEGEEERSSEGASIASVDDEELPVWARRNAFVDDLLARAHALLTSLLPPSLLPLLPVPYTPGANGREKLLAALSSGQLLCAAYNAGVRRSRKPWGYINADAIHDIAALESRDGGGEAEKEKKQTGWTFRRTDNLRLWAAALKLRYLVPLTAPAPLATVMRPRMSLPLSPSSSSSPGRTGSPAFGRSASPRPSSPGPALGPPPLSAASASSYESELLTPSDLSPIATGVGISTSAEAEGVLRKKRESVPLIEFDAKRVARRESGSGWEAMLETAVVCWVHAVADERRGA